MTNQKNKPKFSISKILKEKKKSNDLFEVMLAQIPLEELVALKLELSARTVGTEIVGLPILKATNKLVREAVILYALSSATSKQSAAMILGISTSKLKKEMVKLNLEDIYKKETNAN